MVEKLKKWMRKADFEDRIFLIALAVATPYFGINIVFDLWYRSQIEYLLLDISLLVVCSIFFYLQRYPRLRPKLMNIFSSLIIIALVYYWMTSAGIRGGAAYIFPVLSVLIISISRGVYQYFYLALLIALVFILTSELLPISGEILYLNLLFEFFLNLIILGLLLIIFKLALDRERSDLETQNQQIDKLNLEMSTKSAELEDYNKEIKLIQQNLEILVNKRTEQLHEENKKDLEYSFINAHLVRAPITNILAITQHLKDPKLKELEKRALALDDTVRKIGRILSEENDL
jgi:signal transduction histidine kinase